MKKLVSMVLVAVLAVGLAGCSLLDDEIARRKSEREECVLNTSDAAVFTYSGTEYLILQQTAEQSAATAWVGYLQKFAVVDENRAVLELREPGLAGAAQSLPAGAASVVQFFNIYQNGQQQDSLLIDVNGAFHKAVPKAQAGDAAVIVFEPLAQSGSGSDTVSIRDEDCTQLTFAGGIYQITQTPVAQDQLGAYLTVIAQSRVFDTETKRAIPKEDLTELEVVPGALSQQQRVSWVYSNVYAIAGEETQDAIAVEINSQYLRAEHVQ